MTNVKADYLRKVSVIQWDGLAGKRACEQTGQPESDYWNPQGKESK